MRPSRRPAGAAFAFALAAALAVPAPGTAQLITRAPVAPPPTELAWTAEHVEVPEEIALGTMAVNVWARLAGPAEAGAPAAAWLVLPGEDGRAGVRLPMSAVDGVLDSPGEDLVATIDTYAWVDDAAHAWEIRVRGPDGEPVALSRGAIRVKPRLAADDLILLDVDGGLQAWIGSGAGGFTASDRVEVPRAIARPAAADVDGDGRPDLVVTGEGGEIRIFHDRGGGRLEPGRVLAAGLAVVDAAVGDVDGDGRADLVTVAPDRGLEVRLGLEDATDFGAFLDRAPEAVGLADLDGDGAAEIWVGLLGLSDTEVVAWRPDPGAPEGVPTWSPGVPLPDPPGGPRGRIRALRALPGPPDRLLVLSGSVSEGMLESWKAPADTQAGSEPALERAVRLPGEPLALVTGRFRPGNGAGWLAAVRDPRSGDTLLVAEDGSIVPGADLPDGLGDLAACDLDGDGDDDLLAAGEELRLWINVRGEFREAGESPYLLDAPVTSLVACRWDERSR